MGDFQRGRLVPRRVTAQFPLPPHFLAEFARFWAANLSEKTLAAQRGLLEQGPASGGQGALMDAQRLLLHFGLAGPGRDENMPRRRASGDGNALQLADWREAGRSMTRERTSFVTRDYRGLHVGFLRRMRGFGSDSQLPVFIVGLPRSSTTLIDNSRRHSQVYGAGEIAAAATRIAALGGEGAEPIEGLAAWTARRPRRLACAAPGEASRIESHRASHRGQDAGQLPGYGSVGSPLSASEVHPLPSRLARRGRLLLDDQFPDIRWANDYGTLPRDFRVPTDHGALAEGLPVPLLDVDYEETVADLEGVARNWWPGAVWNGSRLPGIPPGEAAC